MSNKAIVETIKHHMGEQMFALFNDESVNEIYNSEGSDYLFVAGRNGRIQTEISIVNTLAMLKAIANSLSIEFGPANPSYSAHLPKEFGEARIECHKAPNTSKNVFNIRKHSSINYNLNDYLSKGIIKKEGVDIIRECIKQRKNILIAGSTGSGKTTLASAILKEKQTVFPKERIIIIETTKEIKNTTADYVQLIENKYNTTSSLVRSSLRMFPDTIIVGEIRGSEAADLFHAWSTGHDGGVSTIHSNDAKSALYKAVEYAKQRDKNETFDSIIYRAASAIDIIIYIKNHTETGIRKITEILSISTTTKGKVKLKSKY